MSPAPPRHRLVVPATTLALALLTQAVPGAHAAAGVGPEVQRFALVVGANQGAANEPRLRHAERDAARIAETLTSVGDFPDDRVVLLRGGSASDFRDALFVLDARIRREAGQTLLFVFYSGHADARELHLGPTRLPLLDLRRLLDGSAASSRVLVLDACRSGALTQAPPDRPQSPALVPADCPHHLQHGQPGLAGVGLAARLCVHAFFQLRPAGRRRPGWRWPGHRGRVLLVRDCRDPRRHGSRRRQPPEPDLPLRARATGPGAHDPEIQARPARPAAGAGSRPLPGAAPGGIGHERAGGHDPARGPGGASSRTLPRHPSGPRGGAGGALHAGRRRAGGARAQRHASHQSCSRRAQGDRAPAAQQRLAHRRRPQSAPILAFPGSPPSRSGRTCATSPGRPGSAWRAGPEPGGGISVSPFRWRSCARSICPSSAWGSGSKREPTSRIGSPTSRR